jgi:hypothetical protein
VGMMRDTRCSVPFIHMVSPSSHFLSHIHTGQKRRVEILHEHELSDSTLERWCQQLKERGPQIFASSDHSLLAERERQITGLERVIGQ